MVVNSRARRPRVQVTADGQGMVGHAGVRLLADLAERSGLEGALSTALRSMRQRRRRHEPGSVLVDLAVTLADGGDCLSDLQVLRNQPGLFGEVASQTTAWRVVEAIEQSVLERVQRARARARARVWKWGAAPGRATLDFDATLVKSFSEKAGAAPTYKQGFGFHPLLVHLDETREALAGRLRPGNAGANTAQDHVELLDEAWPSCHCLPRRRTPSGAWRCWCGPTPPGPLTASWRRSLRGGWSSRSALMSPSRCAWRS